VPDDLMRAGPVRNRISRGERSMANPSATVGELTFQRHPDDYVHWKLAVDGDIAHLTMDVQEMKGLDPSTVLKQNSYDLGVDLELADAVQRLRFEHPQLRCLVLQSAQPRVFCAGANIPMLGSSQHGFKVNFCKFTNETRLYLEDAAENSGFQTLCAVNGTAAGGGYELALACDWIMMPDDGNTAVSFPEVPLLGVLPGTGGLTRLVDKRKVRRDRADVFSTVAEGIKGRRAVDWNLVDEVVPSSKFAEGVVQRARQFADEAAKDNTHRGGPGVVLHKIEGARDGSTLTWKYVTLDVDESARVATLRLRVPGTFPATVEEVREQGAHWWIVQLFREIDLALLHLRFNFQDTGLVVVHSEGSQQTVRETDRLIAEQDDADWFVGEVRHLIKRVLKRFDITARSAYTFVEPGSAFAGTLFELALASDRIYMLDDMDRPNAIALTEMNGGDYPMANGLSRLETRFLGDPHLTDAALEQAAPFDAQGALEAGLVTYAPDDIDWEDEVRLAVEERASMSPDALTGMEANLRFAGPETLETKIFGRLSAWQNWIFVRPNAVGERGALTCYGQPQRPVFDWRRT
jgi:benzoyl-CoA-dihydrodiol lyase